MQVEGKIWGLQGEDVLAQSPVGEFKGLVCRRWWIYCQGRVCAGTLKPDRFVGGSASLHRMRWGKKPLCPPADQCCIGELFLSRKTVIFFNDSKLPLSSSAVITEFR